MSNSTIAIPQYSYVAIEFVLVLAALALAFVRPNLGNEWFRRAKRQFLRIARRRRLAILICGVLALVLRLPVLPWFGVPEPAIHEEFSYLLAADTFASGRLANPPHPMGVHFDTFQVLQKPTYSSIRPAAQGLFLALGQVVTGYPWAGVCLSFALLCAAVCWMLQGWLPPGWALLGGLFAVLRLGVFTFWMNSYWGGAPAALGGTLVLGALPRIKRRALPLDVFWMASGIALLFTTRAYEGLFILIPVAGDLTVWLLKRNSFALSVKIFRFVVPMTILFGAFIGWMAYYNWRVTGVPSHAPYLLGRQMYSVAPPFLWQTPQTPPPYHHVVMKNYYLGWEMDSYREMSSLRNYTIHIWWRLYDFWRFYIRPVFTPPLFFLPWAWRDRRIRIFFILAGGAILGQSVETWFPTYYGAPLTCVALLMVLQCMRHMRVWRRKYQPTGLFLVRSICVICVAVFLSVLATHLVGIKIIANQFAWATGDPGLHARTVVLQRLKQLPGKQLAIVRYSPGHSVHLEWVFNRADIDHAKIVWARDMGSEKNKELLDYFRDREVWLIEPDHSPPLVTPYPEAAVPAQTAIWK